MSLHTDIDIDTTLGAAHGKHLIGGEWVTETTAHFDAIDPGTGQVIGRVAPAVRPTLTPRWPPRVSPSRPAVGGSPPAASAPRCCGGSPI